MLETTLIMRAIYERVAPSYLITTPTGRNILVRKAYYPGGFEWAVTVGTRTGHDVELLKACAAAGLEG